MILTWQESEKTVARVLGGVLVSDKAAQYDDIDVRTPDGKTYSVKMQNAALRTGNFSFEIKLYSTADTKDGNFARCKADYCCIVRADNMSTSILVFERKALHDLVMNGSYRSARLQPFRVAGNRADGRRYFDSEFILVPVKDCLPLAVKEFVL